MSSEPRYWLVVASKDHVETGKRLGIVQANHGKAAPIKRMKPDDLIVFYSPKLHFQGAMPCKKFTAIARVKEGDVYQGDMGDGFMPYRRNVEFLRSDETDIIPLIPRLSFIKNKQHWGIFFRFGFFEIPEKDFKTISQSMTKKNETVSLVSLPSGRTRKSLSRFLGKPPTSIIIETSEDRVPLRVSPSDSESRPNLNR